MNERVALPDIQANTNGGGAVALYSSSNYTSRVDTQVIVTHFLLFFFFKQSSSSPLSLFSPNARTKQCSGNTWTNNMANTSDNGAWQNTNGGFCWFF